MQSTFPIGDSYMTAVSMPGGAAWALNCDADALDDGMTSDCSFVRCLGHFRMREALRRAYPNGGFLLPPGVPATCGSVDLSPWQSPPVRGIDEAPWPLFVVGDVAGFRSLGQRWWGAVLSWLGVTGGEMIPTAAAAEEGEPSGKLAAPSWVVPVLVVLGVLAGVLCVLDLSLWILVRRRRRERAAREAAAAGSAPFGSETMFADKNGTAMTTTAPTTTTAITPPQAGNALPGAAAAADAGGGDDGAEQLPRLVPVYLHSSTPPPPSPLYGRQGSALPSLPGTAPPSPDAPRPRRLRLMTAPCGHSSQVAPPPSPVTMVLTPSMIDSPLGRPAAPVDCDGRVFNEPFNESG